MRLDYADLGLIKNPFAQEDMDVRMIDREKDWSNITRVLRDQMGAEGAGYSVIRGDYGLGKTFTLIKIEEWVKSQKIGGESNLAIRLRTSDAQVPRSYISNLLVRINYNLGRPGLKSIAESAASYLDNVEERTIKNAFKGTIEKDEAAFKWLWGRKLSAAESKRLEVDFKIDDSREANLILFEFLRILKAAKYNAVVVLFDELEYVLSNVPEVKIASIIHELQSIWDDFIALSRDERAKMAKFLGVFASSPDSWERFLELVESRQEKKGGGGTETFLRRIPDDAYTDITPLTKKKHVEEFLVERLKLYRPARYAGSELKPFTDDYVPFITRFSLGIPGKIITYSAITIRSALVDKQMTINADFALKTLKEYGLLMENPPDE